MILVWQVDDIIDKYYNNKILEKAKIEIRRQIAKSIFFKFDNF